MFRGLLMLDSLRNIFCAPLMFMRGGLVENGVVKMINKFNLILVKNNKGYL